MVADGFNAIFDGGVTFSDFTRADFGFDVGLNFEIYSIDFDIVIFEGSFNNINITIAKLFDVEGIFDADDNTAIVGRDERGILEPGGKISSRNLLFYLSKCVFPNVIHY